MRKKTYEEIQLFVEQNSDCTLLSTEYTGVFDKMRFRCSCGNEFEVDWHHFSTGGKRVCNTCSDKIRHGKRRKHSVEELRNIMSSLGGEFISGEYKNGKSPVIIRGKCGHIAKTQAGVLLTKDYSGLCVNCARELGREYTKLSYEEIAERCHDMGLNLLSKEYTGAREPLLFKCSCGRNFETTWERVKCNGKTRCDRCSRKMSSGEAAVEEWLMKNDIKYVRQKGFTGLCGPTGRKYKFDFYLPDYNLCVEYDGQQHERIVNFSGKRATDDLIVDLIDTYDRDSTKDRFCEDHGIDLLRINYRDKEIIPEILNSKLIPRYAGELKSS